MTPNKNPHAQALGSLGGKARLSGLTPEQRTALGKKASAKRWQGHSKRPRGKARSVERPKHDPEAAKEAVDKLWKEVKESLVPGTPDAISAGHCYDAKVSEASAERPSVECTPNHDPRLALDILTRLQETISEEPLAKPRQCPHCGGTKLVHWPESSECEECLQEWPAGGEV